MTMEKKEVFKRRDWTLKELQYLRVNYATTETRIIAAELNRTLKAIKDKANKEGLTKGRNWSQSEIDVLHKYYKTHSVTQIAKMLGRSYCGVRGKITRLKIRKPKREKKKVQKKPNGRTPKPIGTICSRLDKRVGRMYKFIKVENHKWIPLARYVWIRHNGNIPPRHCIRFKDNNPENCNIDNLMMISFSENSQMNANPQKSNETKQRKQYKSFFESVLMGVV